MDNQKKPPFAVVDKDFVKSSFSKNNPKTCVAVAVKKEGVALRDTKEDSLNRSTLFFTQDEWRAFLQGVKAGEFDA